MIAFMSSQVLGIPPISPISEVSDFILESLKSVNLGTSGIAKAAWCPNLFRFSFVIPWNLDLYHRFLKFRAQNDDRTLNMYALAEVFLQTIKYDNGDY